MAAAATPHLVDATTAGGADAREKALEALRAATERISGEHGKNARRAAIGAGAAEALERLGAFFEAEAAAETDPERGEYVLALADDARAAAGTSPPPSPRREPTRTTNCESNSRGVEEFERSGGIREEWRRERRGARARRSRLRRASRTNLLWGGRSTLALEKSLASRAVF